MLEAFAHNQLKELLQVSSCPWPHNLTLSRFVARSLRCRDNSLVQLEAGSNDYWWLGLLTPLCLQPRDVVLVLPSRLQRHLFQTELPKLSRQGLNFPYSVNSNSPPKSKVWVLDNFGLIQAFQNGALKSKHLIIPHAESFIDSLREALALVITSDDWEKLRRSHPDLDVKLMQLHQRFSRTLFAQASRVDAHVKMEGSEIVALKSLVGLLGFAPYPWSNLLTFRTEEWANWAELDHKSLNWTWHWKPLEPLHYLIGLLTDQSFLLLAGTPQNPFLLSQLDSVACPLDVKVTLGTDVPPEPISLFVPSKQPLPNSACFAEHLLDQSRRLVLGMKGLTILLLDDEQLRLQLTTELAAEFGTRVVHEITMPATNGVVCCRWSWWLAHKDFLPLPEQLIVAILPFASVEDPLIAARVQALKREGRDWFRELLLPEALSRLPQSVAPLRVRKGRMAILDGRLRARSWGLQFYRALEPWIALQRLLPN